MIRRLVFCCMFVAAASLAVQASAQEVLFAYGFEAGSSNRYRVKLSQEMEFGAGAMGQFGDFEVTVKCVSVTDGKASMEMTFDKADMSRTMFGNMSSDPTSEAMVGKSAVYTVDASGEVSDFKPGGSYAEWDQIQQISQAIVESSWYVTLDGRKASPGESWDASRKDTAPGGVEVASTGTYKFKEMKKEKGRDCASVVLESTNVLSGQTSNPMGTFDVTGEGKGKFEFLFDAAQRMIVRLKTRSEAKMSLTAPGGGDPQEVSVVVQVERELL
jgi:hypothetical protein